MKPDSRIGDVGDIGVAYVDERHLARLEFQARELTFLPRQKRRSILAKYAPEIEGIYG